MFFKLGLPMCIGKKSFSTVLEFQILLGFDEKKDTIYSIKNSKLNEWYELH